MTHDNRIWILMSRRLSGEATPAEVEELMQLLEQSPQKQYLFDILHTWFTDQPAVRSDQPQEDAGFEERFRRIVDRPTGRVIRLPLRKRLVYAASVAALIFLGWAVYRLVFSARLSPPLSTVRSEEVLARAGARTKLLLPDGTQVWLNSNSKLKYTNEFNADIREVGLEGEAYFDVAKDAHRPFIVHASSLDIKVLGTSFTIKSYPQDETIETTLLRGLIEVSRKDNPNTAHVILKPNEKLVFNKKHVAANRASVGPDKAGTHATSTLSDIAVNNIPSDIPDSDKVETAWMYNRLVFKGDNFSELAEKMERWYNVRITIRDTSLNNYHFGGAFASETVEEAFKALQLTTAFSYKINGNEIELAAKQ